MSCEERLALKQILCFSCQVQRQISDRPIFPVPPLGETQGVLRPTLGDVSLEGGGGLVLAALSLHWDDLRPVLQHKVDLAVLVGEVPGLHLKLAPELLQNVVFRQRPLELVVAFQQDGAVVHPGHVLEQAGVKDKQLELIQLIKGGQEVLHLGDIINPVQHPGGHQPLDGLLKVPGPAALPDGTVHEFLVGLGQLGDDAAEHHEDASAVDLAVVL